MKCGECGCKLITRFELNVGYCESCHAELEAQEDEAGWIEEDEKEDK